MDAACLARQKIALKSPTQQRLDARPRCQKCSRVLELLDYLAYWDGPDPYDLGCLPRGADPTPRVCEWCVEAMECKSA